MESPSLAAFVVLLAARGIIADYDLVILHTNDVHARVGQTNAFSSLCSAEDIADDNCYAGVARRLTKVNEIRGSNDHVLLLDGGDQYQGTIWFTYYEGWEASHFMNRLQYDAMALGNHEFDNGVDGLVHFMENATFPVLSCNIDATNEPKISEKFAPSIELDVGGETIGVIGYTVEELEEIVDPEGISNLILNEEVASIRAEAQKMVARGVDKIIALGHSGHILDRRIAEEVEEVDVVVGGHSNTFLYTGDPPSGEVPEDVYPVVVEKASGKKALVVMAYAYGKYLGRLDVTFDDSGEVKTWGGNPILLNSTIAEDATLAAEVHQWEVALVNFTTTMVGETHVRLEGDSTVCRVQECNMGNMMTDALLASVNDRTPADNTWARATIGFWNSGGIRAPIEQGIVNLGHVLTTFPFNNELEILDMKGELLLEIFEHSVSKYDEGLGRFLQVSGFKVTYDVTKEVGSRVQEVLVRCDDCIIPELRPLDRNKMYRVVTSSFLYNGGDGFSMMRDGVVDREYIGTIAADAVTNYITQHSPIIHGLERRISFDSDNVVCGTTMSTSYLPLLLTLLVFHLLSHVQL